MNAYKEKFELKTATYSSSNFLDENSWYEQGHGKRDILTDKVLHLLRADGKQFPISQVEFMGSMGIQSPDNVKGVKDTEYKFPIMDRDNKGGRIAVSVNAGEPGIQGTEFIVTMVDNWITRFSLVRSPQGVLARVQDEPIKVGDRWDYKFVLISESLEVFCPYSELQAGIEWCVIGSAVPLQDSRSRFHKMMTWGSLVNQIGFIRKDAQWKATAAHKVYDVSISVDTGEKGGIQSTNSWIDHFMFTFERDWYEECEHLYWYSKYNRANGAITNHDYLSGQPIPMFAGIFDQMVNQTTHGRLTFKRLTDGIADVYNQFPDARGKMVTLYTGMGGMRDADRVLKQEANSTLGLLGQGAAANMFIKGSDRELEFTGYFDRFAHIDGYDVVFKYNPVFDFGRVAQAQKASGYIHPESGFAMESHRMVFLDLNSVEGEANLQFMKYEYIDSPYEENIIIGTGKATDIPPSLRRLTGGASDKRSSTDTNTHSYHRFASKGLQILRANQCLDMKCVM
jgi:hypothetical protein